MSSFKRSEYLTCWWLPYVILVGIGMSSDICLWGRSEESSTYVNGLYMVSGEYNDYSYATLKGTEFGLDFNWSLKLYQRNDTTAYISRNLGDDDGAIALIRVRNDSCDLHNDFKGAISKCYVAQVCRTQYPIL